ncbi:VTT domain-containing protein [Candidatus Daviesbacteria bacterium]|nr:VTT domain-containing protein [Candidatus Daviesbacteria bacterium]
MSKLFKLFNFAVENDLIAPGILIIVYATFFIVVKKTIPSTEALVADFGRLYGSYGYQIIFLAAALESLVLVNFVVPGMVTMALGAIFARTGQTELTLVVLFASLGVLSGYTLDFVLGQFGFADALKKMGYSRFLNQAGKRLDQLGVRGLSLGFVHPNVASFLSLAAGAGQMSFAKFFPTAAVSVIFWMSLWAVVIYALGDTILTIITRYGFLVIVATLAVLILAALQRGEK